MLAVFPNLGFRHLEPRKHFRCLNNIDITPMQIVEVIRNALMNMGALYVYMSKTFVFKCSVDTEQGQGFVRFHVRMFTDTDNNTMIVECQPRIGCIMAFTLAYNRFHNAVSVLHGQPTRLSHIRIREPWEEVKITDETLSDYIRKLLSGCADIQYECMANLVKLCNTADNSMMIRKNQKLLDLIIHHLNSKCIAWAIMAAKCIHSIFRHIQTGQGQKPCLQNALPLLIRAMRVDPTNDDVAVLELQRQSRLAIDVLTKNYYAEIVIADALANTAY